jgi:hypothetical protein
VSVRVFFDPHRVAQLRQQGIDPQGRLTSGPAAEARTALGLVEENARLRAEAARRRGGNQLGPIEESARLRAEVARLRADNQRLSDENARLRGEGGRRDLAQHEQKETEDDAARRFSLLELDL